LSPVFRHGSLRLYLLRLLDEEPRHGYEVIRLLRDRFMGVYSPSPGTIYPRLARLEEEGLVTHDEVDGRKVYRITEAGREELRNRSDELDELEEELSASVNDIVREVREDVRQTVRSLREELTWAARETRRERQEASEAARQMQRDARDAARDEVRQAKDAVREGLRQARDEARQARDAARDEARQAKDDARDETRQAKDEARDEARQGRDQARDEDRRIRDELRDEARARASEHAKRTRDGLLGALGGDLGALGSDVARQVHEHAQRLREEAQRARDEARTRDVPAGAGARFTGDQDTGQGWTGWTGRRGGWEEWSRLRGRGGWASRLDVSTLRDLERVAIQFTTDLRRVAMESGSFGENVIGDLRGILDEALTRIKTEVFGPSDEEPPGDSEDDDR
jgi:DNA-binding PadR family transcriptional regulator